MPMVEDVAARLGRNADADLELLYRDSASFVIRTDDGWKLFHELPRPQRRDYDDAMQLANAGPCAPDPADAVLEEPAPLLLRIFREDDHRMKPYSNRQLTAAVP